MTLMKQCIAIAVGLALSWGVAAATIDVGGAKIEDATEVRGSKLVLNGAGVRYKAVFKVYAAGLYLAQSRERRLQPLGLRRPRVMIGAGLGHGFGLGPLGKGRVAEPRGKTVTVLDRCIDRLG